MKNTAYLIISCMCIILCTCKKYPDGGFVNQTRKHLFGGNDVGDSKTWKLKLYEVNGIDSTYLIQGANSIPDFYEKFVTFKLTDKKYISSEANTFTYRYTSSVSKAYKEINFALYDIDWTHNDSIQCEKIGNIYYCTRNIFIPDASKRATSWNINKLTKYELSINLSLKNSYKIILKQ